MMKLIKLCIAGLMLATSVTVQAVEPTTSDITKTAQTTVNSKQDSKPIFTGKVNLNTATAKELQQLNGIGASKAKAIIAYHKKIGGFKNIEQLKEVKGIGEELFNKNKANLAL